MALSQLMQKCPCTMRGTGSCTRFPLGCTTWQRTGALTWRATSIPAGNAMAQQACVRCANCTQTIVHLSLQRLLGMHGKGWPCVHSVLLQTVQPNLRRVDTLRTGNEIKSYSSSWLQLTKVILYHDVTSGRAIVIYYFTASNERSSYSVDCMHSHGNDQRFQMASQGSS